MKKGTRITLICILSILILAIVGLTIFGYVHRFAYADYIDVISNPNAIVNFNQLVKNDYINGNENMSGAINLASGIIAGHKIYIKFNVSYIGDSNNGLYFGNSQGNYNQFIGLIPANTPTIIDTIVVAEYSYLNTYINSSMAWTAMAIDLELMFGEDNLPNLEQCKELFAADYYAYNSGTSMVANGLSYYAQGYQDAYDAIQANLTYSLVASDVYNNATKFDLGDYCGEALKATEPNIYYVYTNPNPLFNDTATYPNGFYMPFNATITGGAIIKLEGCIATYSGFAEQLTPIYCAILSGDQIKNLYTFNNYIVGSGDVGNLLKASYDLTITLPYDCNGLYFYSLEQFACANLSIKVQNFDLQTAIASARLAAQNQAEEYYSGLYAEGGERYKQIFNNGVQYSLTHNANNAWGSAWDFIESAFTGIGGLFQIELIPGVPLSVFILVPLMISLIFFIVKLTKGGGD